MENRTPPIGEPNATATPAALAAVSISLIFPVQCGSGDSGLESCSVTHHGFVRSEQTDQLRRCLRSMPHAQRDLLSRPTGQTQSLTARQAQHPRVMRRCHEELTRVRLLIASVQKPRKPFMTKPARMHLISDIPDPAAYLAMFLTRWAAVNENAACTSLSTSVFTRPESSRTAKRT